MRKPIEARLWSKVNKTDGCWLWTGSTDGRYGTISSYHGKSPHKAHVVSWEMAHGPVPDGMRVLHECDTPLCVRPSHLFLGTQETNIRDAVAKGRIGRNPASLANLRPGRPGHLGASKEPVRGVFAE